MEHTAVSADGTHALPADDRRRRSALRRRWRQYLPPQHGAWAMLVVPYLVGVLCAGPSWLQLPLLVAWLGGYLLSYYVFLAVKTRRPSRVVAQVLVYSAVTVPAAVLVVVVRPELLAFAPLYAVLVAVNAWYAWRRSERALLNDLASVLQGALMVPVAAGAAGVAPAAVLVPFVVVLLYFAGTVLYVKTMIRRRADRRYLGGSIAYHAAAGVAAGVIAWPLAVPFGWFLVRAAWLPHRNLTPKRVGMIEIANCVVLVVAIPLVMP